MKLLRPNIKCSLTPVGDYDRYGQPVVGESQEVWIAVVHLMNSNKRESVRRDASASQRFAGEIASDARLLFPHLIKIKEGDKVEVAGTTLKVRTVFPRHDLNGLIDHWQVDCDVWA